VLLMAGVTRGMSPCGRYTVNTLAVEGADPTDAANIGGGGGAGGADAKVGRCRLTPWKPH
jgi:hypothetical protein